MNRPVIRIAAVVPLLLQAACAAPNVDRTASGFSELAFQTQLHECRLTTAAHYTWHGLVGAVIGSAFGAVQGAQVGAIGGNAGEGAVIGAAVGSVIGLGAGAVVAIEKETASVEGCIKSKGYALIVAE